MSIPICDLPSQTQGCDRQACRPNPPRRLTSGPMSSPYRQEAPLGQPPAPITEGGGVPVENPAQGRLAQLPPFSPVVISLLRLFDRDDVELALAIRAMLRSSSRPALCVSFIKAVGRKHFGAADPHKILGWKEIRFVSDDPPPQDTDLELRIAWLFLLQNVRPLELRVRGRVLRSDDRGTVLRISKYEFRTCGERSFDQASARADNWSMVA